MFHHFRRTDPNQDLYGRLLNIDVVFDVETRAGQYAPALYSNTVPSLKLLTQVCILRATHFKKPLQTIIEKSGWPKSLSLIDVLDGNKPGLFTFAIEIELQPRHRDFNYDKYEAMCSKKCETYQLESDTSFGRTKAIVGLITDDSDPRFGGPTYVLFVVSSLVPSGSSLTEALKYIMSLDPFRTGFTQRKRGREGESSVICSWGCEYRLTLNECDMECCSERIIYSLNDFHMPRSCRIESRDVQFAFKKEEEQPDKIAHLVGDALSPGLKELRNRVQRIMEKGLNESYEIARKELRSVAFAEEFYPHDFFSCNFFQLISID